VAGGGRIPGDELFSLGGKVADGSSFWLGRLSDGGGHQRSAFIEIGFDWADRVAPAAAVGGWWGFEWAVSDPWSAAILLEAVGRKGGRRLQVLSGPTE
jgi:hypothetical protein